MTTLERFMRKVNKSAGCWEWTACLSTDGYGKFGIGGKHGGTERAHRTSWRLLVGPIPDGAFVLHRCDNKRCVRPSHLFLGTQADNIADASKKGRIQHGDGHWTARMPNRVIRGSKHWWHKNPVRGEASGNAKLTAKQVRSIRRMWACGKMLQREIAARFGVGQQQVCRIVNGLRWASE